MNSLKIPESGVLLKGSPSDDSDPVPQQAFAISLSDNVIEDMIKCVQDGEDIQLALGASPSFHYGSSSHRISSPSDDQPYDLYLTQPYNSLREGVQIPTMSLFHNPRLNKLPSKTSKPAVQKTRSPKPSGNQSSTSSLDSDLEALQNGFAAHDASKSSSVLLSGPISTKRSSGGNKNKTLSWGNGASARSQSTSPALKPIASPSLNPALSSVERARQQRASLVHELAIGEQTTEHLRSKWDGKPEEFKATLDKVADLMPGTKKWAMRKSHWRELDVWKYDYEPADREQAIKNAIKQYDKQRLSSSEPEWDRLNPIEDRGKGINLSKLQANLAKGPAPAAPRIKVQKADGSSTPKDDQATDTSGKTKATSESMARSSSNPLPKTKKTTGSEAQAKRLLGNSKSKTSSKTSSQTPSQTPSQKTPSQKTSPAKPKSSTTATKPSSRVLSQEIIENSDSSGDEAQEAETAKPAVTSKKAASQPRSDKATPRPADRSSGSAAERPAPKSKVTPRESLPRPTPKSAPKRPLDEDDSSSSSGTPLSKRIKPKQPLPSAPLKKKKPVEPLQASRDSSGSSLNRNKNTSPSKSSPLASSPPTNASDLTEDERILSKKRKADTNERLPPSKRHASEANISPEVISQAQRFRNAYSKYEALHHEVSALDSPPPGKLADLRHMRERLAAMKEDIYRKCQI